MEKSRFQHSVECRSYVAFHILLYGMLALAKNHGVIAKFHPVEDSKKHRFCETCNCKIVKYIVIEPIYTLTFF